MYFTYILQSDKDGSYYIGSTKNIKNRLIRHNHGHSKYTKSKRPLKLVYQESYNTLTEARKREMYFKSLKSRLAIEKIIKTSRHRLVA